uniref:FMRFamide-related neuropeptide n=1 Tax=Panagrellus redivivus TaxID=6233 RepID=A0A7E4VI51_PANRE
MPPRWTGIQMPHPHRGFSNDIFVYDNRMRNARALAVLGVMYVMAPPSEDRKALRVPDTDGSSKLHSTMNKLQLAMLSLFVFVLVICLTQASDEADTSALRAQLARFRRFSLDALPYSMNSNKRSELDDPRFFSSAYGKRGGAFPRPDYLY